MSLCRRYVLDSCALLVMIQDQPGAQMVEDLIISENTEILMSSINLGEVLYIMHRHFGPDAARRVEQRVFDTPKIRMMDATWPRVKSAAQLKATGSISYADCFGAALAQEMDATLVTSDPDFRRLESEGRISIAWLT